MCDSEFYFVGKALYLLLKTEIYAMLCGAEQQRNLRSVLLIRNHTFLSTLTVGYARYTRVIPEKTRC